MVDKLKNELRVPVWAIGVCVTILLASVGYTITLAKGLQQTYTNTSNITTIQEDLKNKVDEKVYNRDIIQINNKLDLLLTKSIR